MVDLLGPLQRADGLRGAHQTSSKHSVKFWLSRALPVGVTCSRRNMLADAGLRQSDRALTLLGVPKLFSPESGLSPQGLRVLDLELEPEPIR